MKLFEADTTRNPYTPTLDTFVVSPANARKVLGAFIRKAKKELLIYDPKIADTEMLRALSERTKAGVEIKVIGRVSKQNPGLEVRNLAKMRLHTRTIIRDRRQAFVGSQSLRTAELDSRREVGVIVREPKVVNGLIKTFEADWAASAVEENQQSEANLKDIKKAVKDAGQGAVAAEPHRGRSTQRGGGGDRERGSESARNERDGQGSGEGSGPGACRRNGE